MVTICLVGFAMSAILERIGLTPQAIARGIVEDITALDTVGTDDSEARGRAGSIKALVLGIVGCLALAGCSGTPDAAAPQTSPSGAVVPSETTVPVPPDLLAEFRGLLTHRADAVRRGDRAVFERGVAKGRPEFLDEQRTYFDNLTQLPIA
eukprot:gene3923-4891_t